VSPLPGLAATRGSGASRSWFSGWHLLSGFFSSTGLSTKSCSETLPTSNLKIKMIESFRDTHRDRICMCIYRNNYSYIYISTYIYTIFLNKNIQYVEHKTRKIKRQIKSFGTSTLVLTLMMTGVLVAADHGSARRSPPEEVGRAASSALHAAAA
jgi:hypothetical protein